MKNMINKKTLEILTNTTKLSSTDPKTETTLKLLLTKIEEEPIKFTN